MDQCHLCNGKKRTYHSCVESLAARIAKLEAAQPSITVAYKTCGKFTGCANGHHDLRCELYEPPAAELEYYRGMANAAQPPAPEFKLGPETVADLCCDTLGSFQPRTTARLIAEWLRTTPLLILTLDQIAARIERGDWGRE